ncbi:hypothetical protein HDE_04049 [Halotydeus destructor]|nr:hypothetical protein HDE_04049 [Halotydeus destructor]
MEEFRKATEQFAEVSRKVKQEEATRVPPESELRANGTEDGGTSRLGSATSSIVNVLTRIPGTVVGALTSLTRTIGGLEAEF